MVFLNILTFCNPNYTSKEKLGGVTKIVDGTKLSYVDQLVMFYKTVQKNWDIPNRITVVHSIDYKTSDLNKLQKLDIDIVRVEPDHPNIPYKCRSKCYTTPTSIKGTYRLVVDTDLLALKTPQFDFQADIQMGYAGQFQWDIGVAEYICKKLNLKPPPLLPRTGNLFRQYTVGQKDKLFPYFNNGCILVKESLSQKLGREYAKTVDMTFKQFWTDLDPSLYNQNLLHFGPQIAMGLIVNNITSNYKPLPRGCNFLPKSVTVQEFGKENISLLHYCGCGDHNKVIKQVINTQTL